MTFAEYQKLSRETALYPDKGKNFIYPALGLAGEAGEVADKVKKILRDDAGTLTEERRAAIKDELGDVLWYVSQLATELAYDLEHIAAGNIEKLFSRKARGVLTGSGDNR